jgi:2-keto-myo-inositol isomerase
MAQKIGLNPLTIRQAQGLETKIRITAQAGFSAAGLRGNEIETYLDEGHTTSDIRRLLNDEGLLITDVGSVAGWQFTGHPPLVCQLKPDVPVDNAALNRRLDFFFRTVSEIGGGIVPAISAIDEEGDFRRGVDDFRNLCRRASDYGLRIAFEFIGFGKQMTNLQIANRLIAEAAQDNGGILFDTFHFHRGQSSLDDLLETPVERIFLVHLNDVMDKPIDMIRDQDRLYPGLGVLDLRSILAALQFIGYEGFYSLEIFNEDYWQSNPLQVATIARQHTEEIFRSVTG